MTTSGYSILDSSLIVKLIIKEDGSEKAFALLSRLAGDRVVAITPRYMLAEVFSTLCKKFKFGQITKNDVVAGLKVLKELKIQTVQENNTDFVDALNMAIKTQEPTIYDSLFLCLAIKLNAEFITADAKYYRKALKYYDKCVLV